MKVFDWTTAGRALVVVGGVLLNRAAAQENVPGYLRDRGNGVPASIFGTYITRGQLLIYPFVEYTRDHNREYNPTEFGLGLNQDFRGKFKGHSEQIFIGYGVTDWLAVEFEAAYLHATLEKAPTDPVTPPEIVESGLGDFEGHIRVRLRNERGRGPEVFGYAELTPASQRGKLLINEPDWDVRPGVGVTKGFSWGTMTLKVAAEYNREEGHPILGEIAIEYLKRLSRSARLFLAIEGGEGGAPDEFDLISGLQLRITDGIFFKFDNAVGIMSKATDWAPQVGIMFSFPS